MGSPGSYIESYVIILRVSMLRYLECPVFRFSSRTDINEHDILCGWTTTGSLPVMREGVPDRKQTGANERSMCMPYLQSRQLVRSFLSCAAGFPTYMAGGCCYDSFCILF